MSGVPGHPEPPPMRVENLPYQPPMERPRRPGMLTAIGITSIVLASLGLIGSCTTGLYGIMLQSIPVPKVSTPSTSPSVNSFNAPPGYAPAAMAIEHPELMKPGSRVMVITAMNQLRPMNEQRQQMLDQLLKEAGDSIFPFSEENFTPARLTGGVSASGQLPGASPQEPGNTYFELPNGRIEIADDHAVFAPARAGGSGTVRVYRTDPASTSAASAGPQVTFTTVSVPRRTMTLFMLSMFLNVLLVALLMWAGIMVLRDSRKARPMHLWYAGLKLLAIALATYANWHYAYWFLNAFASAQQGQTNAQVSASITVTVLAVVGCIYPLVLLIALNTRSLKDYYRAAR